MRGQFLTDVVARVVALVERHVLTVSSEIHADEFAFPEQGVAPSASDHRIHGYGAFGSVLQFEVDGYVVGQRLALQHLLVLMVFEHLHTGDVVGIDVVCGDAVASLQQVHFFDVEALDGFAVVLDAAAVGHFDAGHPSQDVANDAVALLLVRRHAVVDGVALLIYLLGAHAHLLQLHSLRTDTEIHTLRTVGHSAHLLSDAQSCGCDDERVGRLGLCKSNVN